MTKRRSIRCGSRAWIIHWRTYVIKDSAECASKNRVLQRSRVAGRGKKAVLFLCGASVSFPHFSTLRFLQAGATRHESFLELRFTVVLPVFQVAMCLPWSIRNAIPSEKRSIACRSVPTNECAGEGRGGGGTRVFADPKPGTSSQPLLDVDQPGPESIHRRDAHARMPHARRRNGSELRLHRGARKVPGC